MALPKLETPTYETTIPSTGQVIEYRPFLVKEEKILMMAQESNDPAQSIAALKKIISACTFGKLDPNGLTTYDAEYIFLQLRIKSVGETTQFSLKCQEEGCDEMVPVTVDLTEVKVVKPEEEPEDTIQLNDSIGMTLKHVTLKDSVGLSGADIKDISSMVASVVDTIYDEEKVYSHKDISKKELEAFIDSLNHSQLEKINKFMTSVPTIEYDLEYTCKYGHVSNVKLRGLQDFFE
jgi:hypothetical protein